VDGSDKKKPSKRLTRVSDRQLQCYSQDSAFHTLHTILQTFPHFWIPRFTFRIPQFRISHGLTVILRPSFQQCTDCSKMTAHAGATTPHLFSNTVHMSPAT